MLPLTKKKKMQNVLKICTDVLIQTLNSQTILLSTHFSFSCPHKSFSFTTGECSFNFSSQLCSTSLSSALPCIPWTSFCGVHLSFTFSTIESVALHARSQGSFTECFRAPQGRRGKQNRKNCDCQSSLSNLLWFIHMAHRTERQHLSYQCLTFYGFLQLHPEGHQEQRGFFSVLIQCPFEGRTPVHQHCHNSLL